MRPTSKNDLSKATAATENVQVRENAPDHIRTKEKTLVNVTETAKKIEAEIIARLCKNNPNIGRYQSVVLKAGPKAFKIAIIYQILDATSKTHHHFALTLQTWYYYKNKDQIEEQTQYNITLDDKQSDEIGILRDSISAFLTEVTIEPNVYAVVKKQIYEKLNKDSTIDNTVESLLEDDEGFKTILKQGGLNLFKSITDWVLNTNEPQAIINKLRELDIETLKDLNIISGLTQFQQILDIWENNQLNNEEEFWQKIFSEYAWVISQLFSHPLVLFSDKAYLGGKDISNKGGNIVDFLYKNKITDNVILIEIKTPCTELLGSKYRQTYAISSELSGAINQLLNYKKQLQFNYSNLTSKSDDTDNFLAISPKTLLIAGNLYGEMKTPKHYEAFELFRSNSRDIEVLTFDEVFLKIQQLVGLLEGGIQKE